MARPPHRRSHISPTVLADLWRQYHDGAPAVPLPADSPGWAGIMLVLLGAAALLTLSAPVVLLLLVVGANFTVPWLIALVVLIAVGSGVAGGRHLVRWIGRWRTGQRPAVTELVTAGSATLMSLSLIVLVWGWFDPRVPLTVGLLAAIGVSSSSVGWGLADLVGTRPTLVFFRIVTWVTALSWALQLLLVGGAWYAARTGMALAIAPNLWRIQWFLLVVALVGMQLGRYGSRPAIRAWTPRLAILTVASLSVLGVVGWLFISMP